MAFENDAKKSVFKNFFSGGKKLSSLKNQTSQLDALKSNIFFQCLGLINNILFLFYLEN